MFPVTGTGVFAMDALKQQLYTSAEGNELLLDSPGNALYIYNPTFGCTKYNGAKVYPADATALPNNQQNTFNQYFCQWVYPSPCSWTSVEGFFGSLAYSQSVPLNYNVAKGNVKGSAVDIFTKQFNITVQRPIPVRTEENEMESEEVEEEEEEEEQKEHREDSLPCV